LRASHINVAYAYMNIVTNHISNQNYM